MDELFRELCNAFKALGIARRFYDTACRFGLEADKEMIGGDIEKIKEHIEMLTQKIA